jgi:hypothetical protein
VRRDVGVVADVLDGVDERVVPGEPLAGEAVARLHARDRRVSGLVQQARPQHRRVVEQIGRELDHRPLEIDADGRADAQPQVIGPTDRAGEGRHDREALGDVVLGHGDVSRFFTSASHP